MKPEVKSRRVSTIFEGREKQFCGTLGVCLAIAMMIFATEGWQTKQQASEAIQHEISSVQSIRVYSTEELSANGCSTTDAECKTAAVQKEVIKILTLGEGGVLCAENSKV